MEPDVPLKEYVDRILQERDRWIIDKFTAAEKAVELALAAKLGESGNQRQQWGTIIAVVLAAVAALIAYFKPH